MICVASCMMPPLLGGVCVGVVCVCVCACGSDLVGNSSSAANMALDMDYIQSLGEVTTYCIYQK